MKADIISFNLYASFTLTGIDQDRDICVIRRNRPRFKSGHLTIITHFPSSVPHGGFSAARCQILERRFPTLCLILPKVYFQKNEDPGHLKENGLSCEKTRFVF
jgi:hypothetical protein